MQPLALSRHAARLTWQKTNNAHNAAYWLYRYLTHATLRFIPTKLVRTVIPGNDLLMPITGYARAPSSQ